MVLRDLDRLVADGMVSRTRREGDRRTSIVTLTPPGRLSFERMAEAHEAWIDDCLRAVSEADARRLSSMLKSFESDWEGEA